jgi:hypothetical protein
MTHVGRLFVVLLGSLLLWFGARASAGLASSPMVSPGVPGAMVPVALAQPGEPSATKREPLKQANAGGAQATGAQTDVPKTESPGTLPGSVSWADAYVLLAAVLVGSIGSAAFTIGVWLGFITPASRPQILAFLLDIEKKGPKPVQGSEEARADFEQRLADWNTNTTETFRLLRVTLFVLFGGFVAAVFQWADTTKFIPIQAFVLGATWPSVVTRVMSGSSPDVLPPNQPRASTPPVGGDPVLPLSGGGASGGRSGGGTGGVGVGDEAAAATPVRSSRPPIEILVQPSTDRKPGE